MPLLDVSEVLLDPDFCEPLTILRRTQLIGQDGVAYYETDELPAIAVVTAGSPDKLERGSDAQVGKNSITVHTTFQLRGPSQGGDADSVLWQGNRYVARKIYGYSQYGAGFVCADCELTDLVSAPA